MAGRSPAIEAGFAGVEAALPGLLDPAWRNPFEEPATLVVVLIGARKA